RDAAGGADVPATVLVIEIVHGRAPVDRGTFVARQFDIEAVAEWLPHEGPAARQVVALRPCLDITAEEQLPEVVQLEVVAERGIHPGIPPAEVPAAPHEQLVRMPAKQPARDRLPPGEGSLRGEVVGAAEPPGVVEIEPRRLGAQVHLPDPVPARILLGARRGAPRSEEHTSELQSRENLVCRLLLEKKKIA